ncbi:hypothetical protein PLESTF_000154600 [Pleodorina starrii]|nr:hypothetical protein PLESTF_000154600 [Pleodorina starrii]
MWQTTTTDEQRWRPWLLAPGRVVGLSAGPLPLSGRTVSGTVWCPAGALGVRRERQRMCVCVFCVEGRPRRAVARRLLAMRTERRIGGRVAKVRMACLARCSQAQASADGTAPARVGPGVYVLYEVPNV